MNYGLEAFKNMPLVEDMGLLPELPVLPVEGGQKQNVLLCYPEDALKQLSEETLLRNGEESVSYHIELSKNKLQAPVAVGETVGELVVNIDGECIEKIPVQTAEAVVPVDYSFYFKRILELFFSGDTLSVLKKQFR